MLGVFAMWGQGEVDKVLILTAAGIGGLGLILVGFVLGGAPLFHGGLSVNGDGLVLTHTLGLRRRRLSRVDRVEAGSAYIVRSSGSTPTASGARPARRRLAAT